MISDETKTLLLRAMLRITDHDPGAPPEDVLEAVLQTVVLDCPVEEARAYVAQMLRMKGT